MRGSAEDKTILLSYISLKLSLFNSFHKKGGFHSVLLKGLSFIDVWGAFLASSEFLVLHAFE